MRRPLAVWLFAITLLGILGVLFASKGTPPAVTVAEAAVVDDPVTVRITPYVEPNGDVVLFDFEDPEETGRFVYGNVNTFVEPTNDVARTGAGSCAATFYVGDRIQGKRLIFYTLMHPARGRLGDWQPYSEFQAAILNSEDFTVHLEVEFADGETSVWRRYSLPPGVWSRLRQPLADLQADGLDLANMKRVSWSQMDNEMEGINTLYFDDLRLIASDPTASQQVVTTAWQEFEQWVIDVGTRPKAAYIPTIHTDEGRISQIQEMFDCGHLDGYVVTEVCVVGGGIAGSSAAIASGRMGVETLLVEQYGFLGGTATAALVMPFMPNTVGGQDLVRGIFEDIVGELTARDGARRDNVRRGVIYFDKEQLKYVLNTMVTEAGSDLMLHTWAETTLVQNGAVEGIIVANKSGRLAILAEVVIDSTGDGDMAAKSGCDFEIGRGYDQYTQATTLFFRMAGVNEDRAFSEQGRRVQRPGGQIPETYMFADVFRSAVAEGTFPEDIPIGQIYYERTMQNGVVSINATRAFEVNATDVGDLTYASVETRRQAIILADFLVDSVPGFENAYLQETGIQIGIRESRRILGEYQLTGRDVLNGQRFSDVIARGAYGIDIHCADYSGCGVVGLTLEEGASYDIPYRCLVPLGAENLLLAGRCISVTHVANGSTRIMPVCSGTGHAAGVAAALSVLRGVTPGDLPYPDLRDAMISQGASL